MMIKTEDVLFFVTDSAIQQIRLMEANDYTLEGLFFRIKIGGKGCGGFTYDSGFSELHENDLILKKNYPMIDYELKIIMDPFTAFYTQDFSLDYLLDPTTNEEGFIIQNTQEENHRGKFFKDSSKLPPWATK